MPEELNTNETVVNVPDDEVQTTEETTQDNIDTSEETQETSEQTEDTGDDLPELPPEQKTAFQKRLEREQKKIREQIEAETKAKYARHENLVQALGGDIDTVERALQEQQWAREAQQQGYATPEESAWYVNQKKMQQELADLRAEQQINTLKDDPLYSGIKGQEKEIKAYMLRTGATAKEAYWATGGEMRAQQLKREAEQRVIAKKTQPQRTVQSDSATGDSGNLTPLPPEIEAQRKRMGLTRQEVEELLSTDYRNIDDYRKSKQKKGK